MFSKILIANRGEIACRIIRTAQRMGIYCIAIYSRADHSALHCSLADEAHCIGAAPSSESYLNAARIIELAIASGAKAIHPGYGFLSENSSFAKRCERAGIAFIGPSPAAIEAMGDKSAAKTIMQHAAVPLVPGYHGAQQSEAHLRQEAQLCGFPLLLKASAGGGGKGMRIVNSLADFNEALHSAKREAISAFDDQQMLLERYIEAPRHIEIQVLFDHFGNGVYLSSRDCSIQRRHQKIIEEAPAPNIPEATRQAMGEMALQAARAIDYRGAGTIEFLYDASGRFYFMEMNTRLQVEHPVTEMVCGLDLVEWQLRIACEEALTFCQDELSTDGHAVEVRVYAEDPSNQFLPVTGPIHYLREPLTSDTLRLDSGVRQGDNITSYYDPMLAKLIAWGGDRTQAIKLLHSAVLDYRIAGVTTNLPFLGRILTHQAFAKAQLSTHFIDEHPVLMAATPDPALLLGAACSLEILQRRATHAYTHYEHTAPWRLNHAQSEHFEWQIGHAEEAHKVGIDQCTYDDIAAKVAFRLTYLNTSYQIEAQVSDDSLQLRYNARLYTFFTHSETAAHTFFLDGECYLLQRFSYPLTGSDSDTQHSLAAPMSGTLVANLVERGDTVQAGAPLVVMEAMKMEYTVTAHKQAVVQQLFFSVGDIVSEGAQLVALSPLDT